MNHSNDSRDATTAARGRAQRAITAVAKAAALGVVFTLAAAGGVLLHLDLPAPRRFAAARVNEILEGSFKGKIAIHRVGGLRLTQLEGVDAEVFDPEGKRVLYVQGLRARIGTFSLLRSLVYGRALSVRVPELTIDGAEVVLEENGAGELGLARAFESPTPAAGSSSGVFVSLPDIHVRHAWIHGHMAAVPVVDADLEDFAGVFTLTPETTEIEVQRLLVRGRGLPGVNPEGAVQARAALPMDPAVKRRASVHYEGRVGDIPVRADGSLDGEEVAVTVDVPETQPGAFALVAPSPIKLSAPVSAYAKVHGRLPVLKHEIHARIGEAEVDASGEVTLPGEGRTELAASAHMDVRGLDVSLLFEDAPRSTLTAAIDASVKTRAGGALSGTFHLKNRAGLVSGQVVPAASVRGEFTERSARGSAWIAEHGAPTTIQFSLQPRDDSARPSQLAVKVETTIPNLNAIQRIGPIGRGSAHILVDGRLDLETKRASASAAGDVAGLDLNGVKLERGFITVAAEGPLESPRLAANIRGAGMRAGGYGFTSVQASARGSLKELDVAARLVGDDRSPTALASAHITNGSELSVRGARIELERHGVTSTATIARVRVADGAVEIQGVTALGLGDPIKASARISAAGVAVKAEGADVDLGRVATLMAREEGARGHLALDVDVTAGRRGARGHVNAQIRDIAIRGVNGATLHISTSMDGTRLRGEVAAALGEVGRLEISASDIVLGGAATAPSAWKTATGTVAITGAVNLHQLLRQVPEDARPVEAAAGMIAIRGNVSRATPTESPVATIEAATSGLALVGKQETPRNADGTVTLGPPPWRTMGLDGSVAVKLGGPTGRTELSAEVHDARGALASLDAGANLPIAAILRSPGRLLALVRDTPVEATINVPRRSLDALPPALGRPPIEGDVELVADLRGTTRAPELALTARGTGLLPRDAPACVRRMDVEANVRYDGKTADVRLAASRDGREIIGADATMKVSAAEVLAGGAIDWDASGDVALSRFPLETVGAFMKQSIAGQLSGKVAIRDLHRAASLEADLDLGDLSLDHTSFPRGKVHVDMKGGKVSASARLDQVDGYAEVRATSAIGWGAALAPTLDFKKPIEVAIRSENFRANAAMPFVQGVFSELDGRIDADAKLRVEPGGEDGHVEGGITLRDGVFFVPQIGERFHGLKGRVIMKPWGTLRFEDFSAEAPTGKLTATADAMLKGLKLESANAKVHIAKGQSVPIAVEGVPMGRAYGDVTAHARMSKDGKRLDVNVDIPMLHVDLPRTIGHAVQPLEPDKAVRVGVRAGRDFVPIPLGPPEEPRAPSDLAIRVAVNLGEDVEVKRDTTIDVLVEGRVIVDVRDKTNVAGQIRLTRGMIKLEGKRFIIDRGVVSFVGGDPADPLISAVAFWDGPEGTRVYAEFSGRPTQGKLTLRSEPALTQDEILALILFGSPDGSFGAEAPPGHQESTGVMAVGMAGGVVTQGLNKAISGITSADITTHVDTSDANSPRPELSVQISKRVSARLGYKLGVPAPGDNPDRTELTLDWRFIRNWSLTAVVGDQGSTSLDVAWRLRY